jgi:hypothetical protein
VLTQRHVVEQHTGDDEGSGKRAAPRLVRARDEPHSEAAVEPKELLTCALPRHLAEDSPGSSRLRPARALVAKKSQRLDTIAGLPDQPDAGREAARDVQHGAVERGAANQADEVRSYADRGGRLQP